MRRFLVAAIAAATAGGFACAAATATPPPDTSPPAGIQPASVTLAYVLNANAAAEGRLAFGVARTRAEHWKLSYGSLDGARDQKASGRDYRIDTVLGPTRTAEGRLGATSWHMNANGQILIESGMHRSDDVDGAAIRTQGHPGVTLLGQVDAPVAAYVVKVDPAGGRLAYFFYDRKTFLLDREEEIRDGRRISETLDDYRTTKGLTEPWHLHTTDGFATNDQDEVLQSLAIGDPIAGADLAIPAAASPLYSPAAPSVSIPIVMDSDRIVIPVRMGGHTVNFLLDSGAEGIVIDKDVVEALKIPEYGRVTAETAGAYLSSDVVIPSMTVGSLELSNVHATSLPFVSATSSGRPIAGLLGYDFIQNAVLHVDYQHETLEAIPTAVFTPPAGARVFPVTFDDGVPTIAATVGDAAAPAFIVDTGADRSVLFSRFADAHPKDVADRGLGTAMQAAFPFVDNFSGVGGSVEYRPVQVGPFVLGPWAFPKWLFVVTKNAASFELEDYDGLVGQDVLRNFDLYLDYPHGKIYLVPNDRFHQRW